MRWDTFRYSKRPWVGFSPPEYSAVFVDALKNAVPIRAWDPYSNTWWFPDLYLGAMQNLASYYFPNVVTKVVTPQSPRYRRSDSPYAILGVEKNAPDQVVKAAFDAMKEQLDPAQNDGSSEPYEELLNAFYQIRWEREI